MDDDVYNVGESTTDAVQEPIYENFDDGYEETVTTPPKAGRSGLAPFVPTSARHTPRAPTAHISVTQTAPTSNASGNVHEKPRKTFYFLPGVSERSKLQYEALPEKTLDYKYMFAKNAPPLPDVVGKYYESCYNIVAEVIYYALSFLVSPIILLVVGILSGLLNFIFAWILSPFNNCCEVSLSRISKPLKLIIQHCLAPCYFAAGKVFSSISVKYSKVPAHDSAARTIV